MDIRRCDGPRALVADLHLLRFLQDTLARTRPNDANPICSTLL